MSRVHEMWRRQNPRGQWRSIGSGSEGALVAAAKREAKRMADTGENGQLLVTPLGVFPTVDTPADHTVYQGVFL